DASQPLTAVAVHLARLVRAQARPSDSSGAGPPIHASPTRPGPARAADVVEADQGRAAVGRHRTGLGSCATYQPPAAATVPAASETHGHDRGNHTQRPFHSGASAWLLTAGPRPERNRHIRTRAAAIANRSNERENARTP